MEILLQFSHMMPFPHISHVWSVSVSLPQSNYTTQCFYPWSSQSGWYTKACKNPLFSSKYNEVIMAKQFRFLFTQTTEHFSESFESLHLWSSILSFWSNDFFVSEWPFLLWVQCMFHCDSQQFLPGFFQLHRVFYLSELMCTFHIKISSSLGKRMCSVSKWLDIPRVVIFMWHKCL